MPPSAPTSQRPDQPEADRVEELARELHTVRVVLGLADDETLATDDQLPDNEQRLLSLVDDPTEREYVRSLLLARQKDRNARQDEARQPESC